MLLLVAWSQKKSAFDLFDDTTYEPERLMYWPSTSRNGIFVYEEKDGSSRS